MEVVEGNGKGLGRNTAQALEGKLRNPLANRERAEPGRLPEIVSQKRNLVLNNSDYGKLLGVCLHCI